MHVNYPLFEQTEFPGKSNGMINKIDCSDRAFHDWYRFVLSFPPHLVREYIRKFELKTGQTILDPFCGTGTTIVEAKLRGLRGIGIEANPMAHFASSVKTNWDTNPDKLEIHSKKMAESAKDIIDRNQQPMKVLQEEAYGLLLKDSISPLPLHKALVLLDQIKMLKDDECYQYELLGFAKVLVYCASNLCFGPEVGVTRTKKTDALVVEKWLSEIKMIAQDIRLANNKTTYAARIFNKDAREVENLLEPRSIDGVFTSPPYPNEKDYSRTTRLESVMLGFINNKDELRKHKKNLIRSNTRTVYKGDNDDIWIEENKVIKSIAERIEARRIELGKTSGFEKLYGKVTRLYFGGMARHLAGLRPLLKRGAYLGYVVGDQASYFQIMIRTGEILSEIAKSLGYEHVRTDLFRTRLATATKQQMREEVIVLRWPGT